MKGIVFVILMSMFVFSCSTKKMNHDCHENDTLRKYVYVDKANVVHTNNGCKSVYKYHSMQSVEPVSPNSLWVESVLDKVCSQCVSEKQIDQLNNIINSVAYRKRHDLYKKLSGEYDDIGTWRQFNEFLNKSEKRKILFERCTEEGIDLGDFEDFEHSLNDYSTIE